MFGRVWISWVKIVVISVCFGGSRAYMKHHMKDHMIVFYRLVDHINPETKDGIHNASLFYMTSNFVVVLLNDH